MRAKAKVITEISARSRRPTKVDVSMLSSSSRACSPVSTVVLPVLTTCFGPRTECAGLVATTGDQPVEQHADGGKVLLDRRLLEILPKRLDIGRDMQRLDIGDLADLVVIAPGEETDTGTIIRHT